MSASPQHAVGHQSIALNPSSTAMVSCFGSRKHKSGSITKKQKSKQHFSPKEEIKLNSLRRNSDVNSLMAGRESYELPSQQNRYNVVRGILE